ncbi:MAG: hypothetical protein KAH84_07545 [Thiomargarita sp.]|nr:hypothetical protein [Thiomargarita sp.]
MQYFDLKILSIFFTLLFATFSLQAIEYYCWKNNNDIRECGNYVPPEYSQKGFRHLINDGVWKDIPPALTAEEIAAQKLQEEEKQRLIDQAAEDQVLLGRFSSDLEIIDIRTSKVNEINKRIDLLQIKLDTDKTGLKDKEERYEQDKESTSSEENQLELKLSRIKDTKIRIKKQETILAEKIAERRQIINKYNIYLERYLNIKQRNNPEAISSEY